VRVVDAQDGTPLPGASVVVLGTPFGGHTDQEGRCRLEGLPAGRQDLMISFIGYSSRKVQGVGMDPGQEVEVRLSPAAIEVPGVVVSALRRTQTFAEAPISMAVAEARQVASHNAFTLAGPLRYASGVSQVDGEVNVRGSSGYSRGTGSRVLLLLDGFPMLAADLGDIKWDAIPVSEVERVEVIKGAGSALYGTGALGGVINVITRDPQDPAQTRFRLLNGLYSQPAYQAWRWREDPMYLTGLDLSHSRRAGKVGLVVAGGHKRTSGYYENDDFRRYHLYLKAVHQPEPGRYWRLMANWALDDHGVFVQWQDRRHPLKVPEGDQQASTVSWKLHLNSEYYRLYRPDLGGKLKVAYYRTGFENTRQAGSLRSAGHKLSGEAQADYTGWKKVALTAGSAATFDLVRSPGDFLGGRSVLTLSTYGQAVYAPLPQAELVAGLRYDWNRRGASGGGEKSGGPCPPMAGVIGRREGQFSPQVGLSYRPWPGTALRASAGRGFRAPSVSEIFTQAEVSGLQVCPNPDLGPERSWSYEAGIRQEVAGRLALDAAVFWNEYRGLIEGRPDPRIGGPTPVARFRNLSRARVRGLEAEAQVGLPHGGRGRAAYTFLDAVEFLAKGEVLPPYCHGGLEEGGQAPLPYRARHMLNAELSGRRGNQEGGMAFQFLSRFERVSGLFPECRRDHLPVYLVDLFFSHRLRGLRLNWRIDNLLQYHYVLTERQIRPLRRLSLAIDGAF
jgi:iron complex outermembrane receptor protein